MTRFRIFATGGGCGIHHETVAAMVAARVTAVITAGETAQVDTGPGTPALLMDPSLSWRCFPEQYHPKWAPEVARIVTEQHTNNPGDE